VLHLTQVGARRRLTSGSSGWRRRGTLTLRLPSTTDMIVGDRRLRPRQRVDAGKQLGLIGLDDHQVVRFQRAADRFGGRGLGVHGVDGYEEPHFPAQAEKLSHTGDLVALLVDGELSEDQPRVVGEHRHQMRGDRSGSARPTRVLPSNATGISPPLAAAPAAASAVE